MGKFDLKVSVIPIGLEKYMVFTINNNFSFYWQHSIYEF